MTNFQILEVPIEGMDCADCTRHVQKSISALPGVQEVDVFLASEKAVIQLDPSLVGLEAITRAISSAGYRVPELLQTSDQANNRNFQGSSDDNQKQTQDRRFAAASNYQTNSRLLVGFLASLFAVILFVVVVGEWLGLFENITRNMPWYLGWGIVLLAGYPAFRQVIRASLQGRVISHTLMAFGVLAALVVGEWATALVVVFFMRVGDTVEHFTSERARRAVKDLARMAPQQARIEHDGEELEVGIESVAVGDIVVVRPGEKIPVDGEVISGQAAVNQAAITGESMPVECGVGSKVYAATFVHYGALKIRADQIGAGTTFGKVIRLVEQAEAQRGPVQRVADKFSAYYLPVVMGIAALTFFMRRDALATAAVLVVACSCSFALATPVAMLASIGAGAKRGLMIKGGKYLELISQADVLLIDKTGTLTLGKPEIVDIHVSANTSLTSDQVLQLAASAEKYSEHPLAEAVRAAARQRDIKLDDPHSFESVPGSGVKALVAGRQVIVGNQRLVASHETSGHALDQMAENMAGQGKAILWVAMDGETIGLLAAQDILRSETPEALKAVFDLGIRQAELLTGDHTQAAKALVDRLNEHLGDEKKLTFRANLLPEDKIEIVRQYQVLGKKVVMVGDGVNDAPALAQADVGIAMGAAGSDIALEAAHIALMRDDWRLVPQVFLLARRTMRIVKMNIGFTAIYNLVGLSLASLGYLPPVLAAAAQSLPDLGILANSAQLMRFRTHSEIMEPPNAS